MDTTSLQVAHSDTYASQLFLQITENDSTLRWLRHSQARNSTPVDEGPTGFDGYRHGVQQAT
jgi:hypothetical protein